MAQKAAASPRDRQVEQGNIFQRIMTFIRQVIAEVRKSVWPTKDEWWTYFLVVLVFVGAVMIFTGVLDLLFGWLSVLVFG